MKKLLRAILAGWGTKKITGGGCGCVSIIVFIILFTLLGYIFEWFNF